MPERVSISFAGCDELPVDLHHIDAIIVAAYIEQHPSSKPTVKQHLAAIKTMFDWLVVGQVIPTNPAASVRPPRQVVRQGKTSVLSPEETRHLLDSISTSSVVGLRDKALIALMVYTFARGSAVVAMKVEDVLMRDARMWLRLEEKGGKVLDIPTHHQLEACLNAYVDGAGIGRDKKGPLFRAAAGKTRFLASKRMSRAEVYRMVRATGITAYLKKGGRLEVAQAMAGHETPRTTALYDRRDGEITVQGWRDYR